MLTQSAPTVPTVKLCPPGPGDAVGSPRRAEPDEPNYWSVVFDVVTPSAWERLVEAATAQARHGDPRAREWIASVLGADSAIEEMGRADAAAGYTTISSLARALEREGRRRERIEYED